MSTNEPKCPGLFAWLALAASAVAVGGSLWLSVGEGLVACPLCFYQRTFAMGVLGVLLVGLTTGTRRATLLALPLAAAGAGFAGFHVWLEWNGTLECPKGILGIGSAPQQSLAALAIVFLLVMIDVSKNCCGEEGSGPLPVLLSLILAAGFVYGGIKSTPPPPTPTAESAKLPLKGCRIPYVDPDPTK